jgi:hypothetical protein
MSINAQRGSRKVTMATLHLAAAFIFAMLFLYLSYLTAGRGPNTTALDINILIFGELAIAGNLGIFTSGNVKVHAAGGEAAKPTVTP